MKIFDLVFLAAFAVSLFALIAAAIAALRGSIPRAFSILRVWLICCAVYMAASVGVAYAGPQRILQVGDPWCFDDWCLTVKNVQRAGPNYTVNMTISSQAKRVTQRANGAWIYLRDENDKHYDPAASDVPLDVVLRPGESVAAMRSFGVPAGVGQLGLVTGHGGPPCGVMSLIIIGNGGCLFHKQTMIRLPIE